MDAITNHSDPTPRGIELSAVGLSAQEESDYRSLIEGGADTAAALAQRWGCELPAADTRLRRLHELGLADAIPTAGENDRWLPAPPDVGLRALLNARQHALALAETSVAQLDEVFRRDLNHAEVGDLVEVVLGAEGVGARFLQLQRSARDEVCAFVDARPVAVQSEDNPAQDEALDRGVIFRVVLEQSALEDDGVVAEARRSLSADTQLRTVSEVPTKLLIADRAVAMVPLSVRSYDAAAIIIKAPSLVQSLVTLFDSVWAHGIPMTLDRADDLQAGSGTGPDDLDIAVLSLVLAGLTDEAVGKRLGVSGRTVQRRLKTLMEQTNSTSRMQLGWEVSERGWVTRR